MQLYTEAIENIPPMMVITFLDSLLALLYTNQTQALVTIKCDIVTVMNIRLNIPINCQANGHVPSEYLTVQHIGMLILVVDKTG